MADHLRKRIRDRVQTVVTNLTTTGTRVFPSRVYPLESANLPGLLVYTLSEPVETQASNCRPRLQLRTVQLGIEAVAKATADLDDTLDQVCKEVEVALFGDTVINNLVLSGLARDIRLEGTEVTLAAGESAVPHGSARMSWLVRYQTREGAPDVQDD